MSNWTEIIEALGAQDIHELQRHGIPQDIDQQIRLLCTTYRESTPENRFAMKTELTSKSACVILIFVTHIATVAMQRKDKSALDLGVVAFDLSDVMRIDYRDAFGPMSHLAFAAQECDVSLAERVEAIIHDISPQLRNTLISLPMPRVARDSLGNLVFWRAWDKGE